MKPQVTFAKFLDMQVCIPTDWTDKQVKEFADAENPSGTEHGWCVLKDGDKYLGGDPERVPCKKWDGFVHMRLAC